MIYLDYAATSPVKPRVLNTMKAYFTDKFGNPGSIHSMGSIAYGAVQDARHNVAEFFNCLTEQVIFTGSGSEGNNLVLRGIEKHLKRIGKTHVIVSSVEHESTYEAVNALIDDGFLVSFARPSMNGTVDEDVVKKLLRDDTGLVYVMYVNNESGIKNPIDKIGELCKSKGILFGSDCVQAAGQFKVDTQFLNLDFAVISGHKIGAPKGIGAVFARDKSVLTPIVMGGSYQEFGLRGGTENVPYIVAMGTACKICSESTREMLLNAEMNKQDFVTSFIKYMKGAELEGYKFNFKSSINPGKVLSLQVDGVAAETLIMFADSEGLYISAGSACQAHEDKPSRVLMEYGLTEEQARHTVRLSFGDNRSEESSKESDEAAKILVSCIQQLRETELDE